EAATNREAARRLQQALRRRGHNVTVPLKPDTKVTNLDLKNHHLLLIGRPATNAVAARCREALPVAFGPQSVVVRGETYAHPESAIVVAAESPFNKRYAVVVIAGLEGRSTRRVASLYADPTLPAAEAVVVPHGKKRRALVLPGGGERAAAGRRGRPPPLAPRPAGGAAGARAAPRRPAH